MKIPTIECDGGAPKMEGGWRGDGGGMEGRFRGDGGGTLKVTP